MANKKMKTVPLNRERFLKIRKLRNINLDSLAKHPFVNRSVKTLLRWIKKEEIPPELLDSICQVLNVDPNLLNGKMDQIADRIKRDPEKAEILKTHFNPDNHPYVCKQKRDLHPLMYVRDMLIENNIAPEELDKLSRDDLIRFYIELDKAIYPILFKYFKPHSSSLSEYSIPMPPDDEIIEL